MWFLVICVSGGDYEACMEQKATIEPNTKIEDKRKLNDHLISIFI